MNRIAWLACLAMPATMTPQVQPAAQRLDALAGSPANVLLLFFVASDCPVSNRYFPEMERLAAEFAGRHVVVRYVYPNPEEQRDHVEQHQREFGAPAQAATLDPGQLLVQFTGVTTTPEAALLVHEPHGWSMAYRGRVDDRYVRFGVERTATEHHDTEVAVRAVLSQHAAPAAGGPPIGCAIVPESVVRRSAQ